ncbi:monocarboxylate transporter 5-like [Strongylocentrotus purpuratus]|uniref:Uncharacterized protein n=1 Tax=Strongylocentrotus purpuratus TaxID=7668 RepID=A0A7M7N513_STRPU|nr:monocarboxylate transporter 5-like [Strongylocentrotus purpuratus]
MMVIGSIIMGVAISMASLASSVVGFAVAMATSGVGYAFVMLPSVVICNRYFTKHFAMALGIIEIGSSLSLVFPLVTEKILEATGLRGTILLLGGISLNMVVCSALLRDPRTLRRKGSPRTKGTSNCAEDSDRNEDSMSTFHGRHKEQCLSTFRCPQEDSTLLHRNQNTHADVRDCQINDFDRENVNSTVITNPTNRDDSVKDQVFRYKSPKSKNPEHMVRTVLLSPFRWLWCFLDLSLCRDEPFLNCIYLATSFFAMVHTAWYIFFVPHALAKGITLSHAVLINLIAGVGEIIGALFQGPVIDRGWMTSLGLFMVMSFLNSVVFFLDPLLSNVMLLAGAGFVNGFFLGGTLTLTSVILKDTVSQARFATSYGLSSLSYGIAGPIGGFTAGWIASLVGYEMAFVFLGGLSSAILLAMIPAYCHYDFKRNTDQRDYRETPV